MPMRTPEEVQADIAMSLRTIKDGLYPEGVEKGCCKRAGMVVALFLARVIRLDMAIASAAINMAIEVVDAYPVATSGDILLVFDIPSREWRSEMPGWFDDESPF